jgi:hypothetical protein
MKRVYVFRLILSRIWSADLGHHRHRGHARPDVSHPFAIGAAAMGIGGLLQAAIAVRVLRLDHRGRA